MIVKCSSCPSDSEEFLNIDDLEAHIAAEHFDCVPFECEKCRFSKFPTEFAIKRHFEEDHRMTEYYIRYKVSKQLSEKLNKVRQCLQKSCESAGIDWRQSKLLLLNNDENNTNNTLSSSPSASTLIDENNRVEKPRKNDIPEDASSVLARTLTELSRRNAGVMIKNEDNDEDINSDVASAAIAAFFCNANASNNENFINGNLNGDSNNNKADEENFSQLYSTLLSNQINGNGHLFKNGDSTAHSEASGDSLDESNNQAQQLLRRIESHISTQGTSTSVDFTPRRKRRRQIVKRFGTTPKLKKRFYMLQTNLSNSSNDQTQQQNQQNSSTYSLVQNNNGDWKNSSLNEINLTSNGGNLTMQNSRNPLSKVNEIQCQSCNEMVTNRATSLNYHVNMKHLKYALFICKGCDKKFLWQRTTIVTHVQRYHNGDESLIEDNSSKFMPMINLRRKAFFPPKFALATAAAAAAAAAADASAADGNAVDGSVNDVSCVANNELENGLLDGNFDGNENFQNSNTTNNLTVPSTSNGISALDNIACMLDNASSPTINTFDNYQGYQNQIRQSINNVDNNELNDVEDIDARSFASDEAIPEGTEANPIIFNSSMNGVSPRQNSEIKLKCADCHKMILANKQWILLNHINYHLQLPLFECSECKQIFTKYLRSYAVVHMKKYHNADESLLIDHRPRFIEKLHKKCFELFNVRLSN